MAKLTRELHTTLFAELPFLGGAIGRSTSESAITIACLQIVRPPRARAVKDKRQKAQSQRVERAGSSTC
jgi:hypothetical protein